MLVAHTTLLEISCCGSYIDIDIFICSPAIELESHDPFSVLLIILWDQFVIELESHDPFSVLLIILWDQFVIDLESHDPFSVLLIILWDQFVMCLYSFFAIYVNVLFSVFFYFIFCYLTYHL